MGPTSHQPLSLGQTGEVLREFDLALAALDRRSAENALTFLRVNLRLDAMKPGFPHNQAPR